ncbi:uncharacterized protein RCO7_04645 [Rhynchosporium graminicola]|uniref:WSC domain-containing protein n=1 Tax=Rhynchosporium graminicola TaxID=2792576 RepID=A0A1E1JT82_9HELO|nr:uncharacterized protein RCO7_04645 [Rhynchosporium commune]
MIMGIWKKSLGLAAVIWPALVHSFAPTDSTQDADPPQSGYLPNHNMDPELVKSSLALGWKLTFNLNEVFYAKPLVYTPPGAPNEYVITVSNQNNVRIHDGLTGALIKMRTLDAPFASSDAMCGDMPNTIGIAGTPVIDTATDIMYFFSKGYKNGQIGPQGTINGVYKLYAVNLPSLVDVAGFPIVIDGHNANNDPTRYFVGGTILQRPGLAMLGNTIIGGFGGHCDKFNYTGMLVAVSKTAGVGVTNIQAMQASPGAPKPQELDIFEEGGGKAGIWQGGMGIAADINRVFFITGQNGGQNGAPASGKTYLSTLEQAVVNMAVNPSTGALKQQDYFETYAYDSNNGGDTDFGSGGLALLDPTVFYGTGVSRIALGAGKDAKLFIMNADNLGGFAGGKAGADNVIQTINVGKAVLGGCGSYPLEGGYIYINPSGMGLYAYKFGRDGTGKPVFTQAGVSERFFTSKSVPTVTSNNGAPGSGIVWLTDVNWGLQAYNAIPVNGVMTPIVLPTGAATGGITKFQRAVFGDGRVYTVRATSLMMLTGGGVKGKQPLTCTPYPIAFGNVMTGQASTLQIQCTANTAVTSPKCGITSPIFRCPSTPLPAYVASGASFTFGVTFDLSSAAILAWQNATGGNPLPPGAQGSNLNVYTTTSSGYLPGVVVPMSGTVVASGGYLTVNQTVASFSGVFIGGQEPSQASKSVLLTNRGSTALVFQGFAWQDYYADEMPYHNVTLRQVGNGYTSPNFPVVGTTLAAGATFVVPFVFKPSGTGIWASYITWWSDGGYTTLLLQGIAEQGAAVSSTTSKISSSTSSSSTVISTSTSKTISSGTTISTSTLVPTLTTSSAVPTATGPAIRQTVGGYNFQGCWTESTTGRALNEKSYTNDLMTLEKCATFCSTAPSYSMFGVEYGRECWCGDVLSAGSIKALSQTDCKFLCPGDPLTYCGAGQRLQLYALEAASSSSSSSSSSASVISSMSSTTISTASSSTTSPSPTSFSTSTNSASTSKTASSTSTSALPYITPPKPKQIPLTWSIGWVQASPDGFSRPMIGINGQFPCPAITANKGDSVKITLTNNLVNQSTAIHFHGIFQTGTAYSDGPAHVTQCPITPGASFVYEFKIDQPGTYWYHAHIGGQYIDGLRGPILINDVNAPYRGIDTEYTLTLSDLYHSQAPALINYYQSTDNANTNNGAEPVPNAGLINEAQNVKFSMVAGKKYLFRIINMGAFAPFYLQFDQHDMTVVEIDGVYTKQTSVSQLFITVAQRYSVIVTAKADASKNFAIKASMSTDMFNPTIIPATFNTEVSAYLIYNTGAVLPAPLIITPSPFDDSIFTPYDQVAAYGPVTMPIEMTISFGTNQNGQYRGYLNGVDYIPQKVPTLYTAINAPLNQVNNASIYGANTNSYVLPLGAVVELTLQNHDAFAHPFHLHGHNFQVLARTQGGPNFPINIPAGAPMRRDVVQVMSDGSVTIRFVADNPGIALFHCHIEWHVEAGLTATFIEAPTELQAAKLYIPVSHRSVCDAQSIPRKGNAAGNSKNYLDLTGANVVADTDIALFVKPGSPAPPFPLG